MISLWKEIYQIIKGNHLWVEGLCVCSFFLCFYSLFMRIFFIKIICHFKIKLRCAFILTRQWHFGDSV